MDKWAHKPIRTLAISPNHHTTEFRIHQADHRRRHMPDGLGFGQTAIVASDPGLPRGRPGLLLNDGCGVFPTIPMVTTII